MSQSIARRLLVGGLLLTTLAGAAADVAADANPSLTLVPAKVTLDLPMPVASRDLAVLLAQAGSDNSLSALRQKSIQTFSTSLRGHWRRQLGEFFADEEIPLVAPRGVLTLRSSFDIAVDKQLTELTSFGGADVEHGTLKLSGAFHYRLQNAAGATLRERRIDVGEFRLREKYRVSRPRGAGAVEDDTDEVIEEMVSQLAEELLDQVEDDLEADSLRALATL